MTFVSPRLMDVEASEGPAALVSAVQVLRGETLASVRVCVRGKLVGTLTVPAGDDELLLDRLLPRHARGIPVSSPILRKPIVATKGAAAENADLLAFWRNSTGQLIGWFEMTGRPVSDAERLDGGGFVVEPSDAELCGTTLEDIANELEALMLATAPAVVPATPSAEDLAGAVVRVDMCAAARRRAEDRLITGVEQGAASSVVREHLRAFESAVAAHQAAISALLATYDRLEGAR